jgi:hypothetical protein
MASGIDFEKYGYSGLRKLIDLYWGGTESVAQRMGLPVCATRARNGWGKKRPNGYWQDWERSKLDLMKLVEISGGILPSQSVFAEHGLYDLYVSLPQWGGVEGVSKRLGLSTKRLCIMCKRLLPSSKFSTYRHGRTCDYCKGCSAKKRRAYRMSWEGWMSALISSAKCRSKKAGLDFDLDLHWAMDQLVRNDFSCEVTGIKFQIGNEGGRFGSPSSPSLDRKLKDGGYTKDNVRIISCRWNIALGNFHDDEIESLAIGYLRKRGFDVCKAT